MKLLSYRCADPYCKTCRRGGYHMGQLEFWGLVVLFLIGIVTMGKLL